jgi:hypothetical protein
LDKPPQYLRDGLSINALKRVAGAVCDTNAARPMQQAKAKLFEGLQPSAPECRPKCRTEEMTAPENTCTSI